MSRTENVAVVGVGATVVDGVGVVVRAPVVDVWAVTVVDVDLGSFDVAPLATTC